MAASKLTNEDKLKRIIYFGLPERNYRVKTEFEQLFMNEDTLTTLQECFASDVKVLLNLITAASEDKSLPRRKLLFYLLAKALHYESTPENVKSEISNTALNLFKSDEDFFDFIMFSSRLRHEKTVKIQPSVRKVIQKFYKQKSPLQLVESYAKNNGLHSWAHKDLIKISHFKSDSVLKNMVVNYILFQKITNKEKEEEIKLIEKLEKSKLLRSTKDPDQAVALISELKATIQQVSPDLHQNAQVWTAVIENMSVQEILPHIGKLYKLGFLKANCPTQTKVISAFTTTESVKSSGVHPIQVFIHQRTFEKGGKPRDPKLLQHLQKDKNLTEEEITKIKTRHEPKSPMIINAFQKCMNLACNNLSPTNKRYLITIDVTDKAVSAPCIGNKAINSVDAAVAFAAVLLRLEKDVVVATYNDKEIKTVPLEKKGTYAEHLSKVLLQKSKYAQIYAPVEWAASEKKHIDVFVNFIHHDFKAGLPEGVHPPKPGCEPLAKYRKKVNLPNAKLVNFCLTSPHFTTNSTNVPNVLEVLGFDVGACKAVEVFCRGSVS